jgi:uncharacterized protein
MMHPIHAFCFAELVTPDLEPAKRFYGDVIGWTTVEIPGQSRYATWQMNGRTVAGLRPAALKTQWIGYVHVESVDRAAARALNLGARVVIPASDTPGVARTCVLADPEGAALGLWEPGGVDGTDLETGPGSLWWMELMARRIVTARAFYTSLFEWSLVETMKFETGKPYTLFKQGDRSVGGGLQFDPEWGMVPTWQVYVEVDDFASTSRRACDKGGQTGFWRDVPAVGRIGVIVDPGGAAFLVAHPLPSASSTASATASQLPASGG